VFDGVWQEGDDIANSAQPNAVPGDVKIRDLNGDKKIDGEDRQIIGQRDPKWTWGWTNTFTYKNWSLYIFAHGVQGITKLNDSKFTEPDGFDGRTNFIKRTYWTPENPVNNYPRNNKLANPFGVRSYEKADFIRIKDITLSYELSKSVAKEIGFKNMKAYVTGRNLFTISNWDGMDPEFNGQRSVPLQKEFVVGLQLSF
jgi:hypothetical protein